MRIEYVDNKIVIYYYDEINEDNFIDEIIKCAKNRYNIEITGLCTLNVYKDSIIIIEIVKNSYNYDYEYIDMHIINKKNRITYEIEDIECVDNYYVDNNKIYTRDVNIKNCEHIKSVNIE